ncbi:hypothetical protein imdm_1279 [gamma proteobacterium IMCC2047]|nr:hypothetical protein imdm_1279 [gamma proteobacterium IMCC2047]
MFAITAQEPLPVDRAFVFSVKSPINNQKSHYELPPARSSFM